MRRCDGSGRREPREKIADADADADAEAGESRGGEKGKEEGQTNKSVARIQSYTGCMGRCELIVVKLEEKDTGRRIRI